MLKKIIVLTLLLHTALLAQPKEKSFFVGVDVKYTRMATTYETYGQFSYTPGTEYDTQNVPTLKLGYQYHLTRIYLEYSKIHENYEQYNIRSKFFDLNFEYIPVVYQKDNYQLRGIFGVSIGINYTYMYDLEQGLRGELEVGGLNDYIQNHPMYGFQLGGIYELDNGVSFNAGFKLRMGDFIQMKEDTQQMSIRTYRKEFFAGINYLF